MMMIMIMIWWWCDERWWRWRWRCTGRPSQSWGCSAPPSLAQEVARPNFRSWKKHRLHTGSDDCDTNHQTNWIRVACSTVIIFIHFHPLLIKGLICLGLFQIITEWYWTLKLKSGMGWKSLNSLLLRALLSFAELIMYFKGLATPGLQRLWQNCLPDSLSNVSNCYGYDHNRCYHILGRRHHPDIHGHIFFSKLRLLGRIYF